MDNISECRLTLRGPYSIAGFQRYPVIFIRVGNDIYDSITLVMTVKRVSWLPMIPFVNSRLDSSFATQKYLIEKMKAHCVALFGKVTCDFEEAAK